MILATHSVLFFLVGGKFVFGSGPMNFRGNSNGDTADKLLVEETRVKEYLEDMETGVRDGNPKSFTTLNKAEEEVDEIGEILYLSDLDSGKDNSIEKEPNLEKQIVIGVTASAIEIVEDRNLELVDPYLHDLNYDEDMDTIEEDYDDSVELSIEENYSSNDNAYNDYNIYKRKHIETGIYNSPLLELLRTNPTDEELFVHLNITQIPVSEHRRKLQDTSVAENAGKEEGNKPSVVRTVAILELKVHVMNYLVRNFGTSCRRTDNYDCLNGDQPLKSTCGNFCVEDTWGCVVFVADVAVDVFDVLSNFVPMGKAFSIVRKATTKAVKGAAKGSRAAATAGDASKVIRNSKPEIQRIARQELKQEMVELRDEMITEFHRKWGSKENPAKLLLTSGGAFMQNEISTLLLWVYDLAIKSAAENLIWEKIIQSYNMPYINYDAELAAGVAHTFDWDHPRAKFLNMTAVGEQSEIDQFRDTLSVLGSMDPSGVISLASKLFFGPTCKEQENEPYGCKYGEPIYTVEEGKKCCAGASNPEWARRLLENENSENSDQSHRSLGVLSRVTGFLGRGSGGTKKQNTQGEEKEGEGEEEEEEEEVTDSEGKPLPRFIKGVTTCNEKVGVPGGDRVDGPVIVTYPTDFMDSQLNLPFDKTVGLYFQVPSNQISKWRTYFGYGQTCTVEWSDVMKAYCFNADNEFRPPESNVGVCVNIALNYFEECEINPYKNNSSPVEVRQCRGGKTVATGRIVLYNNWMGRWFGRVTPTVDDWESGDILVPFDKWCPLTGYEPPEWTIHGCGNNKYWGSGMLDCEWVGKNPYKRCSTISNTGIPANDYNKGCRKYCSNACYFDKKPASHPNVGIRISGYAGWSNPPNKNYYFKFNMNPNSWEKKVWNRWNLEPIDEGPKGRTPYYKVYEAKQCREGKLINQDTIVIMNNDGSKNYEFGRWEFSDMYGASWLDGDVIIPVGSDFDCADTTHTGTHGTWQPVSGPTKMPTTRIPTRYPTTRNPTPYPTTRNPTPYPTRSPTNPPDNPPYGARIFASYYDGSPAQLINGVRSERYFSVDHSYRYENFRENCLDSFEDGPPTDGASYVKRSVKLCRSGNQIHRGVIRLDSFWTGRWHSNTDFYNNNYKFQEGDVLIPSDESCYKTYGSYAGGRKCSRQKPVQPGPVSLPAQPGPVTLPATNNNSPKVFFSASGLRGFTLGSGEKQNFATIFDVTFSTSYETTWVKHCAKNGSNFSDLGSKEVWYFLYSNSAQGACVASGDCNLSTGDYFTTVNGSC